MRYCVLTVIICLAFTSNGQDEVRKESVGFHYEFAVLPLVLYNQANIGVSYRKNDRSEHSLEISPHVSYFIDGWFNSFGVMYSHNRTLNIKSKSRLYIPIWLKSRRFTSYSADSESGASEAMLLSIGSGIGIKRFFRSGNGLKIEVHFGVGALNRWGHNNPKFYPTESVEGFRSLFNHFNKDNVAVLPIPRLKIRYTIPFN